MNPTSTFSSGLRTKNMRRHGNTPIPAKKPHDIIPAIGESLRIVPLGGVEEIGKNMTVVEFGNDIIVIDAGIQFTDDDTPGVDYILPNIKYLEERKDRIRALVITHGHLDHIGGIPYLITRLGNPPIYTREFGALLIKKRQAEFPQLPPLDIRIVEASDKSIPLSPNFKVRFFGLTHSIPDSTGIIIETPYGDIVNTGDVRVENENGVPVEKEVEQYKIFKDRNVILFTMDSTGIDKPGFSPSEASILKNIDAIVAAAPGRIILATFASQVERIVEFLNSARRYGKKVVIEGRSMKTNVEIIKHLNLVDVSHIVPIEDIEKYPPNKIMMIATGAQGEEFAALMRMSNKTHKFVRLQRSDTIVLSSSVIPGNDRAVEKLKDNLFRHDAKIITYLDSDVHTSGHGKRGELEWVHKQIPYKYFMPVHGSHFRLKMHAELAAQLGTPRENIIVPDNGSIIEIQDKGNRFVKLPEKAPSDDMVVEGLNIGDISEVVIRDRKMLAEDGIFVIIALINTRTGRLKKSPDIIARGFVYLRESQELLSEARNIIKHSIEGTTVGMNPINFDYAKNAVTEDISRFLFQRTAKKPIVIPVILGV
ncbi:MAG: RNA-metabolising metallo-beta-lactamase [Parcubacteria group bacterium GW2011_GWA2_50_10b]|nr:MAG: RNA-metabolising metallo-beta-lactamase [Parcubacteria group bacterium GW2011_GWA2_50_10b]